MNSNLFFTTLGSIENFCDNFSLFFYVLLLEISHILYWKKKNVNFNAKPIVF